MFHEDICNVWYHHVFHLAFLEGAAKFSIRLSHLQKFREHILDEGLCLGDLKGVGSNGLKEKLGGEGMVCVYRMTGCCE